MESLLFGAAYYPEHDPEQEWEQDARLMRDLGFNAIRVGEFCWNRMQQPTGALTLDWLERAIALFDAHGIKTILCTPTATPPVWAMERFPDLPVILPDHRKGLFGGRRHYSMFHDGYRRLSVEIAAGLAQRFGRHPGVIGWHIDNEIGSYSSVDCSPPALRAFHAHLERTYGTVDELNRRWGLIFWNQEVQRFDQVPAPLNMMATRNPQYLIAYNRFCLEGMADYILQQAAAIRAHADRRQWIVGSCTEHVCEALFRLQRERKQRLCDHVELNSYPELLPQPGRSAMYLDRIRAIARPGIFLTLEQQTGSSFTTSGGLDPRIRDFWNWETIARGSRSILWFHWRRFRTGCEWRHTSVVYPDSQPRTVYRSLQSFIRQARKVEPLLCDMRITPDAQILYDHESAMARDRASESLFWMEIQLPEASHTRFPLWEKEVRRAIYLPLTSFGLTVDFVLGHEKWNPALPLFIPDLDLCDEAMVTRLERFINDGGTVACFPGTGERNRDGAQLEMPSPGLLGPLFGVTLADSYPLPAGVGAVYDPARGGMTSEDHPELKTLGKVRIAHRAIAVDVRHAELLNPVKAEVLGRYADGLGKGGVAMTTRRLGRGRAIYLGAVPADVKAAAVLYHILFPALCRATCRYWRIKGVANKIAYEFLMNDTAKPVRLPRSVRDLITGKPHSAIPPHGTLLTRAG